MNFTLIYLYFSLIHNSPLISISNSFRSKSFYLKNNHYSKSFSSFLFSYNDRLNIHFDSCKFNNLLSRAISIQKTAFLIEQYFEITQQLFEDNLVSITNCIFHGYNLEKKEGAAIYINNSCVLYNVLFSNIVSYFGSVYCEGNMELNYVTFSDVKASRAASFVSYNENDENIQNNVSVDSCLFLSASSNDIGSFFQSGNGVHSNYNSNFTNCRAKKQNGCFECSAKLVSFSFSFFNRCEATENSIALIYGSHDINLSYNIFNELFFEKNAFTFKNSNNIIIRHCNFLTMKNLRKRKGNPSSLIEIDEIDVLNIFQCCFDGNEEEIVQSISNHILKDNNQFNTICQIYSKNMNVGYMYHRTPTYLPVSNAPRPTFHYRGSYSQKKINIDPLIAVVYRIQIVLFLFLVLMFLFNRRRKIIKLVFKIFKIKNKKEIL